ncbi:amidohydrolase [Kineococcus esterisolvens]|uniref:amidohydrolase n=1 Tax=unclassified Kineococcus TaxID=2621656 RepID=UPI003D7E1D90
MSHLTRRTLLSATAATTGVAVAGAAPASAVAAGRGPADLVIVNGRVLVMDERCRTAEALAVRDGRIIAVGSAREVRRLTGRRAQVLDAAGGTVLPGINDSHLHLNSLSLNLPPYSYPVDTGTVEELVAVVRDAVAATADPGAWIRGQGWNDNRLPRAPRASDLDPVSGDHPVVLTDFSFHATTVNTVAMRLAGITRDTVAPAGGVIEKDADGEPTGVLREGAQNLVRAVVPAFSPQEVAESVRAGTALLHQRGITSITEPGIGLNTLAVYADEAAAGRLRVRITALLSAGPNAAGLRETLASFVRPEGVDERLLRVGGVKVFGDGIPTAAKTAWLHDPYLDGTNGSLTVDGATIEEQVAELGEIITAAVEAGMQVGTHATGDATIDAVVEAYTAATGRSRRRSDLRHYVIHGDLAPLATLATMAQHDIGMNMNASIKHLLGDSVASVLGDERSAYQAPYRSALDAGVRVTSASDAPVTMPDWLVGVFGAETREGVYGGVTGPEQAISRLEALTSYTRTPAWQDHAEAWKGTLQRGMVADVCIVEGDLLGVDAHDLPGLTVSATVLGGTVVHDATAAGSPTSGPGPAATAAAAAVAMSSRHGADCLGAGACCCRVSDRITGRPFTA